MFKKLTSITLVLVLLISSFSVFAEDAFEDTWLSDNTTKSIFSDVNTGAWYFEAVMTMNRYGIISGYPDGTFGPDSSVSREEFAVMMVKTLELDQPENPQSSFDDVSNDYWATPYIEAAKNYITGYNFGDEINYKPKADAIREDMAVALVKALGKSTGGDSLSALDDFEDKGLVSEKLYEYVSSAIYNNLMSGDGKGFFKPMDTLTRAEAAAMLLSVLNEEGITFDFEEKIITNGNEFVLKISQVEGALKLDWNYDVSKEITGYKVVASRTDTNPTYPDNGYYKYAEMSSATVYNGDLYHDGDFYEFKPGEEYYFSITVLVGEESFSSNTVRAKMPEAFSEEGKVPEVSVSQLDKGILVQWNDIGTVDLQGYKIVASKYDDTPVYPENGYAKWITDPNIKSFFIEPYTKYNGGDFGGVFMPGETYHISVTAVYNSGEIAGNAITYIMPGELEEPVTNWLRKPNVEVIVKEGNLVVEWSEISTYGLSGYKIVASKTNPNPIYSQDGYAFWITDLSTHRKEFSAGTSYNGGDLGGNFVAGEKYYVSVTAVYNDVNIAGNAVMIVMPD